MKTRHHLLFIAALLSSSLSADTIVLKTGVKYEGKVISESQDSYLVEIHHSKSIKDERKIPKDHVKEIIREAKDAKDFAAIEALVPTPDRVPLEAYAKGIKTAKDFLTKYPKSSHTKKVKGILETLEKEQQVIAKGGIKLDGQLITESDMEANAYEIHARMLFDEMKNLTANSHHRQALRKWEILQKTYEHSSSYNHSMALARRILRSYSRELKSYLDTLTVRAAKRQSALESLSANDRQRTIAALAENAKNYEALVLKEEKELHTKWLTIDPYNEKALQYNLRSAETSLKSVASYDASQFKPAGPAYRGAWSALAKGNLAEANKCITELKALQLPEKYTEPLITLLSEKQTAQKAAEEKAAQEQAEQERLAKEAAEKARKEAEASKKKNKGKRRK